MKWLWLGCITVLLSSTLPSIARGLDTVPTTPPAVSGPFQITAYSFSGAQLRYVQIYNTSTSLASLDGWRLQSSTKTPPVTSTEYITLSGLLPPGKHAVAAVPSVVSSPIFVLPLVEFDPSILFGSVSLIPPNQMYLTETMTAPNVTTSSPREVAGTTSIFHVRRDISSSTGNYVTGSSYVIPTQPLKNDVLYETPVDPLIQVVEIYPSPIECAPFDPSLLCTEYVKLYNASSSVIQLDQYRLRTGNYGQSATSSNTRTLSGMLIPGQYAVVNISLVDSGGWVWIEDQFGQTYYASSMTDYPSVSGFAHQSWAYDTDKGVWRWNPTPSPLPIQNSFPPDPTVNRCESIIISEIAANVDDVAQFIEIQNASNQTQSLDGCRLQTNRSSLYFELGGELNGGQMTTIFVSATPLTLTKTTTGTVYVLSSDGQFEASTVEYANLKEKTSYASINGEWLQTYTMTPDAVNRYKQYPDCVAGSARNEETGLCNKIQVTTASLDDCGPGKYRSPETNRCRSLETLAAALTPCEAGQYRSAETNRCRSLTSASSVLTPCSPGQERNPETNRCRSIASSSLQPCAVGQERNPETNRCRKTSSATSAVADFPVESVKDGAEATLGWWAFGGMGVLAAGYAGWEWRREVSGFIRRISRFSIGRQ